MNGTIFLLIILLIWNLITFALMGIDKHRAVTHRYRISEKTLFLCAFLFGGIGIACGMFMFRHKTKHLSFRVFVPAAVIVNIVVYYFLFSRNMGTVLTETWGRFSCFTEKLYMKHG